MKIDNLLEIINTEVGPEKQYRGKFKTSTSLYEPGEMGRGLFSKVLQNKKDPHTVKKYTRNFDYNIQERDGFTAYADYIINNNLQDNPYFPKIYKKNIIRDREQKVLQKYEIEKLNNINLLTRKELFAIFYNLFGLSEKHVIDSMPTTTPSRFHFKMEMVDLLLRILNSAINGNADFDQIQDDNLAAAIKHLQKLKKIGFIDIHKENVMFRRTPYGVQLVFSDPIGLLKLR